LQQRTLNLGILAHVDAGKTTLTERLLYAAGVIDEIGSVDDGSTQTDSLALERQRGITIKSAVVSFPIDDLTVNLIDTPGHPDFIAEVERVLSVLDGAVLVISAVEGVQPQTRILMRALQRLHVPTLLFVNKIDRCGAGDDRVVRGIAEKLTAAIMPMGSAFALGTRTAGFTPSVDTAQLAATLAERNDALLSAYVDDVDIPSDELRDELAAQTKRAALHPVFFGSAITGAGVVELMKGIAELLPSANLDGNAPASGNVFKIERGPTGDKIAFVRMFAGTLSVRDRVRIGDDTERKVTAIAVLDEGRAVRRPAVSAGQIAKLWGLSEIQIGDPVGEPHRAVEHHFAPPTLETVVVPISPRARGALRAALTQLAEQDPLINVRQDDVRQELSVSLYGEVQKEVIQATLASDYGLEVRFRETTTICIERPAGTGEAVERLRADSNPFLAGVGLRIEPAPPGSGVSFQLEVELGSMPIAFFRAVEDTMRETLREGLYGWELHDCAVTMTHSGYFPRQSHAHQGFAKSMSSTGADFRGLTPLVVMDALKEAGTTVFEPVHRFRLDAPADVVGPLLPALARLRAVAGTPDVRGSSCTIEGDIAAAQVHELRQQLPALTKGEGVLECAFDRYEPATGSPPTRARTDNNPLNREEYLLRVAGRVQQRTA
jgi:ribosomal protection tetracycline resistance protein